MRVKFRNRDTPQRHVTAGLRSRLHCSVAVTARSISDELSGSLQCDVLTLGSDYIGAADGVDTMEVISKDLGNIEAFFYVHFNAGLSVGARMMRQCNIPATYYWNWHEGNADAGQVLADIPMWLVTLV